MFPAQGAGAPQQQATPQPPQPSPWAPPQQGQPQQSGFAPQQQQAARTMLAAAPPPQLAALQQQHRAQGGYGPPAQPGLPPPPQQAGGFPPPPQQAGFPPPPQQAGGFPPPPQQAGFPPPPQQANQSYPPQQNYAPPGGGYPPPPQQGQQPYSPVPAGPAPIPQLAPAKKQGGGKGLIIGLLALLVLGGGGFAVWFFALRGGGGAAGGGSRNEVVKGTLAALAAGDVDSLLNLNDHAGLFDKMIDCSGKTKPRKKDDDSESGDDDEDKELSEKDKEERDPKKQREKAKKEYEELAAKTKGAKIELVEITTKEPPKPSDDEKKDKDGSIAENGILFKTGDRLMKGCYAKQPGRIHMAKLKLKITPPGEKEAVETETDMMLFQVGGGYWLATPPNISMGLASLEKELRGIRDQVCACKDAACAEKLKEEFKASPRRKELKKQIKDLEESEKEKIDKIEEEIKTCESKLAGEGQLDAMERFRDQMCACVDKTCADKVTQEMTVWGNSQKDKDQKLSEEDLKRAAQLGEEMAKCMQKVYMAETGNSGSGGGIGSTIASAAGGLPASCVLYKEMIDKLSQCDKMPKESRDALKQGFDAMEQGWANIGSMPPEAVKAMDDACKQGGDALKQAGTTMGCF